MNQNGYGPLAKESLPRGCLGASAFVQIHFDGFLSSALLSLCLPPLLCGCFFYSCCASVLACMSC